MALKLQNVASRIVVLKFQEELEKRRQEVAAKPKPVPTPPMPMATPIPQEPWHGYGPTPPRGGGLLGAIGQGYSRLNRAATGGAANLTQLLGEKVEDFQNTVVIPNAYRAQLLSAGVLGTEGPPGTAGKSRLDAIREAIWPPSNAGSPTELANIQQSWQQNPAGYRMGMETLFHPASYYAGPEALARLPEALALGPEFVGSLGVKSAVEATSRLATAARPAIEAKVAELYPVGREAVVGGEAGGLKLPFGKKAGGIPKVAEAVATTPEEVAVQKLTGVMNAAKKASPEYTAALRQKRLEMAPQIDAIRKNTALSPEEMSSQIAAVRKGTIEREFQLPEDLAFTSEEITGYGRQIFASDVLKPQESKNAYDALNDVLNGLYIPPNRRVLLTKVFGPDFGKGLDVAMGSGNFPLWKKIVDAAGIPRILKSSLDISFPLRQGIMKVGSKEFWQMWKPMFRAVREKSATESYQDIITSPAWEAWGKDSGIAIADPAGMAGVAKTVEGYVTYTGKGPAAWVERLPGIKQSQEMYATAGNELRWKSLKNTVEGWDKIGATYGPEQIKAAARWENITTGWGYLGNLDKNLPALAQVLFAPRFWASRLEALPYGAYLIAKEPLMRAQVMRDLVTFAGVNIGLLATLKLSGLAEVELDPRSTDFGRARIGPTRIDLLGGMQPAVRQVAQLMSGRGKSAATSEIYGVDRLKLLGRTLQGKLSPQAGFLVDVLRGETFVGEEMALTPESAKAQAWNRLAPMAIADLADAIQAHGVIGGLPLGALAAAGGSVLTYGSPFDKQQVLQDTIAKEHGFKDFEDMISGPKGLGAPAANKIIDADQRIIDLQPEIEKYKATRGSPTMPTDMAYDSLQKASDTYKQSLASLEPQFLTNAPQAAAMLKAAKETRITQQFLVEQMSPDLAKKNAEFKAPTTPIGQWTADEVFNQEMSFYRDLGANPTAAQKDAVYQKIDGFEAQLSPDQYSQLQVNIGAKDDPVMALRRSGLAQIDKHKFNFTLTPGVNVTNVGYYDIDEAIWEVVRDKNLKGDSRVSQLTYQGYKDWLAAQHPELAVGDVLQRSPVVRFVDANATKARQAAETKYPEIVGVQVAWGLRSNVRDEQLKTVMPHVQRVREQIRQALAIPGTP